MRFSIRVTRGWMHNHDFLRREDFLAKHILAITLTKRAMLLNGHTDQEMERVTPEDRHKFI
jgi:hypothetical protein